jgi:ketosteroid isomerase-like protein
MRFVFTHGCKEAQPFLYIPKKMMHSDKELIENARKASNAAIVAKNANGVTEHYLEDIIVISGEGGKHAGKKSLTKIWNQMFTQNIVLFERLPSEIIVADSGKLAWESGVWKYVNGAKGGNYSAMWCKVADGWKTRSELFVSLD